MIHKIGNMFTTTCGVVGHGVNLRGVMGAGVARIVRGMYPEVYEEYVAACADGTLKEGDVQVCESYTGLLVVNMATQVAPGPNADLTLIANAATRAANVLPALWGANKMAIPRVGCGIGGLQWEDVEPLLKAAEWKDFEFEVWSL